jgi:hypothetical protein
MKRLHCDGCGVTEELKTPKHEIEPVSVVIVEDPRFPDGIHKHEADLCLKCSAQLLHTYFRVPMPSDLKTPAFLEPVRSPRPAAEADG